ncbi:MAG: DUF4240 domain-containing protein [Oscillospiraceae bacterium]|nr:DUF4240 domain-containing protein [Oscillospiraceae bacterium]
MTGRKFWQILKKFDWDNASDDDEVMQPALDYLASLEDEEIFAFEELMAEHLYALDTRELAEKLYAEDEYISDDMFLYQRCVALINGQSYYNGILNGKIQPGPDLEFEAILYLPSRAWAKKHNADPDDYPYITKTSYETGSNAEKWKK